MRLVSYSGRVVLLECFKNVVFTAQSERLAELVSRLGGVGGSDLVPTVLCAEADRAIFIGVKLPDLAGFFELPYFIEETVPSLCEVEVSEEVETLIFAGSDGVDQQVPGSSRSSVPNP